MITFLPYAGFHESARALDDKRLGKQRVEARQLMRALEAWLGGAVDSRLLWSPACLMWSETPLALAAYCNAMIDEWVRRGFKNTMVRVELSGLAVDYPSWLGREDFHASHRAALLAKDPTHYGQFGWTERPRVAYVWP